MKIIVCVKQVPSSNEVNLDPVTKTIIRDGRQAVINPFDMFALETAVELKEKHGGEITVMSMGIPAVSKLLKDCIARGADKGLLISGREFAGADTLATSYTLSLGASKINGYDLILCGKMAIDGDTAQIGPELAEQLGIPHVTDVCSIIGTSDGEIECEKKTAEAVIRMKVRLPALFTVSKDANMPRMPSITGVEKGIRSEITVLGANELEADITRTGLAGSPTQVLRTFTPELRSNAVKLEGNPAEQAKALLSILKKSEVL